ncbi:MAG TPA: hypothetical protein VEZ44_08600 [bacterium]|nr:hypothetical protein [bacterium]
MTRVPWLLAWRSLADRPWRAALLLLGYGMGVAVMISLLSVGEALLAQARDPNLAAGGDLVLLPAGVDPAVLKVNGVTGLYLSIPNAAFITRELLLGPRFAAAIAAAAPEMRDRQIYVRVRGRVAPAVASAGVPSLDRAAGAHEGVPGAADTGADRAWLDPVSDAFYNRGDRFHEPTAAERAAWAEWDYVTFLDPSSRTYGYLTLLAGGTGRGAIVLRVRRPGRPVEDVAVPAAVGARDVSTTTAAQRIGPGRVWVSSGGYRIVVRDPRLAADLTLTPVPGLYLPPAESEESALRSGYVVPVLRGWLTGTIATRGGVLRLTRAEAYHDHNWGTWRGVTWEWGEASAGTGAMLYGELHAPDPGLAAAVRPAVLFLWAPGATAANGFAGVFEVKRLLYGAWHAGPVVRGHPVRVPGEIVLDAAAGPDRVHVRARVWDALASSPLGASGSGAAMPDRAFLQLRTVDDVSGTVDGRPFAWTGQGASETYVAVSGGRSGSR